MGLVSAMDSPTARRTLVFVNLQLGPIWVKEGNRALFIAYTSVVYCFENEKDSLTIEEAGITTGPLWRRSLNKQKW